MNKTILEKFLLNQCTDQEIDIFFNWLSENKENSEVFMSLKKRWNETQAVEATKHKAELLRHLDRIHHKINIQNSERGKTNRFRQLENNLFVRFLYRAAVLLLILLTLYLTQNNSFQNKLNTQKSDEPVLNEIISPVGSRIHLELSDGTRVWLNHGSRLVYPQQFSGDSRKVQLVGEAFFDVAPNLKKPFVVEKGEMTVVATGTEFNVKNYVDDNTFAVTLKTGKVKLTGKNTSFNLNPGQYFSYNKTNRTYSLNYTDTEKYLSWKDGKLIFKDDSFDEIASRLSRWYNVDIELIDPEIRELTYTATFIDEPLYQILEMLEIVTPIKYEIEPRYKLQDGTYSKRKILVYLKNQYK